MKYVYWIILWPLSLVAGLFGRLMSPIVCMFVKREPVFDTVKRLGKRQVLLPRERLVWCLTWFDTDDNCTDEYWYGMYDESSKKTQEYYGTHAIYRWYCRVMWLNRNSMYTFNRKFFGLPKDSKLAWQLKKDIPLAFGYYNSVNIGFKAHKGFDRLMLAGRLIGVRGNFNSQGVKRYLWNILIWIDQGANTLIGGDPDETLSSRMGKYVKRRRGFIPCVICKMLDLLDKNHCIESIEADRGEQV